MGFPKHLRSRCNSKLEPIHEVTQGSFSAISQPAQEMLNVKVFHLNLALEHRTFGTRCSIHGLGMQNVSMGFLIHGFLNTWDY